MKILEKISIPIIILTIVLLNICIGSNIKDPIWIIQLITSLYTFIYIIIKKINKEKNIIIKGKIDIAVLILMVSTIIPLLFQKYVTLDGTINFILKYWSFYSIYILIRNEIKTEKQIKIIVNSIIISSIIPIIFGFDKFTFNIFEPLLNCINAVKIEDYRMISTFGYANTFAAYLTMTTSLAIASFLNTEHKKSKIAYAMYIILSSICIILTQSKFVLALIAFIIVAFIIKWIKEKRLTKKSIIIGVVALITFIIYFFIAIQISKPLEINTKEKTCVIRGIESNTDYTFEFDINAQSKETSSIFEVKIVEINRYFSEKTIGKINFSTYSGKKEIQVQTGEQISHIEIRINNPLEEEIIINELKINSKPYILEYKIIPEPLVRVFTTFNFKNTSVFQRADYWRDGLEIVKDNWLLGAGGNTWRVMYGQVQNYLYYAKEAHCYLLELWMSFGIIGILSFIFIIAITLKNGYELIKKQKDKKIKTLLLAILIGCLVIIVHSFMDFDLSYLIMQMMIYILIAILNKDDKTIENKGNIIDIFVGIVLLLVVIGNVLGALASVCSYENSKKAKTIAPWISKHQYNSIVYVENNKIDEPEEIKWLETYMKNEPYNYQNIIYEIMTKKIMDLENEEEIIKYSEELKETWENTSIDRIYEISAIEDRGQILIDFAEYLMEKSEELSNEKMKIIAKEIAQTFLNEYEQNSKNILDYNRNTEQRGIASLRYNTYTHLQVKAKNIIEK